MADNVSEKSASATLSATSSRTVSIRSESPESVPSTQDDCMLKLAALVYLRLKKLTNIRFILNADVADTGHILSLHLEWTDTNGLEHWITFLVALAHIRHENERNDSCVSDGSPEDELEQKKLTERESEPLNTRTFWLTFKSALDEMNIFDLEKEPDESKSHTTKNNEMCFIVYTTDDVACDTELGGSVNMDFPFHDLFSTGNPEDIVSFGDECPQQQGEDRETEYYKFFLPRLKIFAKQRGPIDLNALITSALTSADEDLILEPGEYLSAYLDWMKQWRVEYKTCLTETSVVLEKAVMRKLMEDDNSEDIRFHQIEYENTINMLHTVDILYITVPDISKQLRSCKVICALQKMYKNNFVLSGRILNNYPLSILSVLCDRACDAIVINSDLAEESIKLLNAVSTERLKNIVVISSDFIEPLCQALLGLQRTYKELTEVWTLNVLEDSQQEILMDNSVSFQGRLVGLRALESVWPTLRSDVNGPMLNTLISGEVGVLGAVPSPYIPWDPYIDRLLCHRSAIKPNVLQMNTDEDVIMVTGIPKKLFNDMLSQAGREDELDADSSNESAYLYSRSLSEDSFVDCESLAAVTASGGVDIGYSRRYTGDLTRINPSPVDPNKSLFVFSYAESGVLNAANHDYSFFSELCVDYKGKSIHWITYDDGILTWKNTYGPVVNILPYVDKMGPHCSTTPICSHYDSTLRYRTCKQKVITLVGGNGMGKSTLLKKIASELLKEMQTFWIIEIILSKFRYVLQSSFKNEEISFSEIIDFLHSVVDGDSSTCPKFCRSFLKYSVEKKGNCVILIDGLDELEEAPKESALRLIKALSETNVGKIWVSVTKKEKININESLRCHPLEIQPIDAQDQAKYLTNRWGLKKVMPGKVKITSFPEFPFCDGTALFTVPLYIHLFAGTYAPPRRNFDVIQYVEGFNDDLPRCSVYRLYRDYVKKFELGERKRQEAATPSPARSKKSKKKKSAAPAPPPALPKIDLADPSFFERTQRLANHVTGGNKQMAHRSFSNFYMALWLKDHHATLAVDFLRQNVLPPDEEYGVHSQLDWLLGEGLRLHEVAVSGEEVGEVDVVWDIGRVHARDLVGRQALHLAVIYNREDLVFQLLQAGAEVNAEDDVRQWTPLDYADATLNLAIIEMLLHYGGDPSRLKTLRERSEQEKLDLMVKRAFAVHEMEAECRNNSLIFVVPVSDIDVHELGLGNDLINNKDNSFNKGTVFYTLELPRPYMFPLLQIACVGYVNLGKYLLENNCADDPCLFGVSALHVAAYHKRDSVVKLLLDHGLPCNKPKVDGQTPLHVACKMPQNLHTVKVLLAGGADVNSPDKFWMTPAMVAAAHGHPELLSELIKHGIHLESADQRGRTALFHAVQENKIEAVKVLLDAGANIYTADKFEIHPMQVAIAKGFSDIVLEMYQRTDITKQRDLFGATPLHHACAYQQLDLLVKLLVKKHPVNVSDSDGVTPLHIAAKMGNMKFVDILLKRGSDCKSEDRNGLNALHYATMGGNDEIIEKLIQVGIEDKLGVSKYEKCLIIAAMVGKVKAMRCLLRHGAVIDTANPRHCVLLHYGNVSKNNEMISLLLDVGIDPNVQEPSAKNVPLHIAVQGGVLNIVKMLLEKGANPNMTTEDGRSPLHSAAISGHTSIAKALLEHGADPNLSDRFNFTPVILATRFKNLGVLKALVEAGGQTDKLGGNRWSALHVAVIECDLTATEYLLSTGMDVNIRDPEGFTPLLIACGGNAKFELVQFLIDRGADRTAIDITYNRTALHNAAYRGKIKVVALLLELGLNIEEGDKWDSKPLHLAAMRGHLKCVRFLVNKGANVNATNSSGESPLHMAFENKQKTTAVALMNLGADPRNVNFHKLDIWDIIEIRADYIWNSDKLQDVPEQLVLKKPIKRMSEPTLRQKRYRFPLSTMSKIREKLLKSRMNTNLNESEEPDNTASSHNLDLVPPEEVKKYFPTYGELKKGSLNPLLLGMSPQQRPLEVTSKTVLPQEKTENTPKKPQDYQQPGSSKHTPPPEPAKHSPPPEPAKHSPPPEPAKHSPPPEPAKHSPPPEPAKHTPPPEPAKHTPPPIPAKRTSIPIPAKRTSIPIPAKRTSVPIPAKRSSVPEPTKHTPPPGSAMRTPPDTKDTHSPEPPKNVAKQLEPCNVSRKEEPKLDQPATSRKLDRKKSKTEKLKEGSEMATTENVTLKKIPEDDGNKDESSSKYERRRRRRR